MEVFKLKKPKTEVNPERVIEILRSEDVDLSRFWENANSPEYLYWDKVRYKPRPKSVTAEELWALIKFMRQHSFGRVRTVIHDTINIPFTWQPTPGMDSFLHNADMQLGGNLGSVISDDLAPRRMFIIRGIMEEAIASSQLEGANTTRKAAKRMIVEKRAPSNRSERMIVNNYKAMIEIEDTLHRERLTLDRLFQLHSTLTQDTIDVKDVGRLRKDKDKIVVSNESSGIIYHTAPLEGFLKKEIKRLILYANDELTDPQFVHPVIKAIILHFWIGYLHPFTDGNGRLARIVFYWYLLRKGYWAFSYLPLSRVIKNSAAQYRDAYVYSEQDDNDLTYFIDYNVRKIAECMRDFEIYCKRKASEIRKMSMIASQKDKFNGRQMRLLRYLHKNPTAATSIKTHATVYGVTRPTARKDLEELETLGFLTSKKTGRDRPFRATDKTAELFA